MLKKYLLTGCICSEVIPDCVIQGSNREADQVGDIYYKVYCKDLAWMMVATA